jgi:cob(I)alamin adenosyltransferase
MVKINKIYTKTGDNGTTGLVGGSRIEKASLKVEAYGELDELNCHLGMCRTLCEKHKRVRMHSMLALIQNEIFDIGAVVASPAGKEQLELMTVTTQSIERLEAWIDELISDIPELRSFVLPGGTELNASLHVARAVTRRVERRVNSLTREENVPRLILIYLNRLSDLLFAMARAESQAAKCSEYLWEPAINKK